MDGRPASPTLTLYVGSSMPDSLQHPLNGLHEDYARASKGKGERRRRSHLRSLFCPVASSSSSPVQHRASPVQNRRLQSVSDTASNSSADTNLSGDGRSDGYDSQEEGAGPDYDGAGPVEDVVEEAVTPPIRSNRRNSLLGTLFGGMFSPKAGRVKREPTTPTSTPITTPIATPTSHTPTLVPATAAGNSTVPFFSATSLNRRRGSISVAERAQNSPDFGNRSRDQLSRRRGSYAGPTLEPPLLLMDRPMSRLRTISDKEDDSCCRPQLAREHAFDQQGQQVVEEPPVEEQTEENKERNRKFDEKLAAIVERMTLEGYTEEDILAQMTREWRSEHLRRYPPPPPVPGAHPPTQPVRNNNVIILAPSETERMSTPEPVPPFMNRFLDSLNRALGFDPEQVRSAQSVVYVQQQALQPPEPKGVKDLNKLPVRVYHGEPLPEEQSQCAVCMCDYEPDESLRSLPCFHFFHAECVDKWLGASILCPVCKYEIPH